MFWGEFLTIAIIHLLAVISPGPDFAIVSKNSLSHSRNIGVYTAIGVGVGIGLHVTYSLAGISLIISRSILLFNMIKYLGALYIIYLGTKALMSQPEKIFVEEKEIIVKTISKKKAFLMGFLTNALNPKATVFFLSIFTQVINPNTPNTIRGIYGIEMMIMTAVWFSLVALFFSNNLLKTKILKYKHYVDRSFGVILIALGLKVATSK